MYEQTRLGQMILKHWLEHRPRKVEELQNQNQLENRLRQVEDQTADLLYELVSVQKLDYRQAWEMATQEWAFLPTEDPRPSSADSIRSRKNDRPATSG